MKNGFAAYLLKRFLLGMLTLLVILLTSYALMRLAPGDPTKSSMLGEGAGTQLAAEKSALARNDSLREKLHLENPVAHDTQAAIKTAVDAIRCMIKDTKA